MSGSSICFFFQGGKAKGAFEDLVCAHRQSLMSHPAQRAKCALSGLETKPSADSSPLYGSC